MNRINDKIKEIEKYIGQLESVVPLTLEEYESDFKIKAICEHYFEKIVESAVDLAFLFIKNEGLKIPEDDKNAFEILQDNNIISEKLSRKLQNAKGMRNIISHEYGQIDDSIVFEAVGEQLEKDINEFIGDIKEASIEK